MPSITILQLFPRSCFFRAPFWVAFLVVLVHGESSGDSASTGGADESDPTKDLLKQLTIGMMEVIDERTVSLRPTSAKESKKPILLRLGNVGSPSRGSLSDSEYAEKVQAAKAALTKLADKQALWYKAAPDSVQPPSPTDGSPQIVIADLWNRGGRHVNTALKKEGHLSDVHEYESDIAKDILGAAAQGEKEESYKKLGEAMKEHDEAQRAADRAAGKGAKGQADEAEAPVEGFGAAGWLAIALLLGLVIGVATNFGQPSKKKTSLNRKKGTLEQWWMKLKGA